MVPGGKVIPNPLFIQFEIIRDFVFDGSDKKQLLICHISIMEVICVNLIIETLYICVQISFFYIFVAMLLVICVNLIIETLYICVQISFFYIFVAMLLVICVNLIIEILYICVQISFFYIFVAMLLIKWPFLFKVKICYFQCFFCRHPLDLSSKTHKQKRCKCLICYMVLFYV